VDGVLLLCRRRRSLPQRLQRVHDAARCAGIEAVRRVVGAGRFTANNPGSILDYDPEAPGSNPMPSGCAGDHVAYHLALGYPEPRIL